MATRPIGVALWCLLVAAGCGEGSSAPPSFDDVTAVVGEFVEDNELEGAGLIVVDRSDGVVYHEHWGTFDEDRVSLVASSSKVISAGVLLALQDEGALAIDAALTDAVEWAAGHPGLTAADLVSNRSGLVGLQPTIEYEPYACQWDPAATLSECGSTILTTTADDADVVAPGTEFRYGGGQWQVAGAVAEAVSGRRWAELIREVYVAPCELSSLGYTNQLFPTDGAGFVYPDGFDPDAVTANPNIEAGAHLTTGDFGALLLMHLRDGRCGDVQVLSESAVETMRTDRTGDGEEGFGYGLGWWIDRSTGRLQDPGAYGSLAWIDPEGGYGAFLLLEASAALGAELAEDVGNLIDDVLGG